MEGGVTDRQDFTLDDALTEEVAAIDALPDYLTREEAWGFLRVTERTLDRMLERGELARRRFGGRTLIPRASLRALVLRQATTLEESEDVGPAALK
jgi:excisionase family DNA binding protein